MNARAVNGNRAPREMEYKFDLQNGGGTVI